MSAVKLRPYQTEAVTSVLAAWANGVQRPAVVLPCGLGKTVIFSSIANTMAHVARRRPVILVHRDELVRQTVAKLQDARPGSAVGVIQGKRCETLGTDVVVASVQTLVRRLDRIAPNRFDVIVVDEAHHAVARAYRECMEHFGAYAKDSGALAVGVSATLARTDREGLGDVWEEVVYSKDIRYGIENGFLVPVEARSVVVPELDMSKVRMARATLELAAMGAGRDLDAGQLAKAMAQAGAAHLIVQQYLEHARDDGGALRRGIAFTPTVDAAHALAAEFVAAGVPTEVIVGATDSPERQAAYARVVSRETLMLVSVMVLSEGFDLPCVEVAVVARPTRSVPLYVQMVGRVFRPSPATGKASALILDVCGVADNGLACVSDLSLPDRCECGAGPCGCTPRAPLGLTDTRSCRCGNGGKCAPSCGCFPVEPEEDELDADDLEPAAKALPVELDVPSVIMLVDVDPFTGKPWGQSTPALKSGHRHEWLATLAGTPFLPSTREFASTLFVWHDAAAGNWVVGRKVGRNRASRLAQADSEAEARKLAEHLHPGDRSIFGTVLASPKQVDLLRRFGDPHAADPRLTAGQASRRVSIQLTSRALDGS